VKVQVANVTTAAVVAEDQKSSNAALGLGGVTVEFYGGKLNEVSNSDPAIMKKYTRRAQLREIFELVRATLKFSGVFHTSPRGWFTFRHALFSLLFFFGHIWYCARTLFGEEFIS
ncbi:hypothetical protein Golax_025879, partial [Gossypium laxum]|nr:hypothetical protein [Gossypium laxum]